MCVYWNNKKKINLSPQGFGFSARLWKLQTVSGFCSYNLQPTVTRAIVCGLFLYPPDWQKGLCCCWRTQPHHSLQIFYFYLASLQMDTVSRTYILRNHFPEPRVSPDLGEAAIEAAQTLPVRFHSASLPYLSPSLHLLELDCDTCAWVG